MHQSPNNKIYRRIPHIYSGMVKRVRDERKRKMLLNSYIRGFFRRNEPELELVDIKDDIAILTKRGD